MVQPITTYVTQKRLSWYGHVMKREETHVAKKVTTMKGRDLEEGQYCGGWTECGAI